LLYDHGQKVSHLSAIALEAELEGIGDEMHPWALLGIEAILPHRVFTETVDRYTRSVRFEDSLKLPWLHILTVCAVVIILRQCIDKIVCED